MQYRLPKPEDREILLDYVNEHYANNETSISASLGLTSSDYLCWVNKISNNASLGDEEWGKSLLYLCFDNDKLIGLLSVRYELPDDLVKKYGHIGYGVRPSLRNRGYGEEMCRYGLSTCQEYGLREVIVGCYKNNLASARVILKNGGILAWESLHSGLISQYYRVEL